MRLIVDATAVREHGGGLSTYAVALVGAWADTFPDDELVVVAGDAGGERIMRAVAADVRVSPIGGGRFVGQNALIPLLTRRIRPHAMLALVPSVPILPSPVPIVSVVYDMRSWMHPEEFPLWVRAYRSLAHHYAFHRSARLITISERSRRDLAQVCRLGASKTEVIYPAADHVDAWPTAERARHVVTFGHWTNKRPGMAIEAWATALRAARSAHGWQLHVVGVPEPGRAALRQTARELGVTDSIVVHGYLPDAEYQRIFTSASAVLMLSTFEGFGLPVVEAMRRGVHVIASRDAALQEAGGHSAVYVEDEAGVSDALRGVMDEAPEVGRMITSGLARTRGMTWAAMAVQVRNVIEQSAFPAGRGGLG